MKEFLKKNLLLILSLFILLSFITYVNSDYIKYDKKEKELLNEILDTQCIGNEVDLEYCNEVKNRLSVQKDYFTMLTTSFVTSIPMVKMKLLLPFFVVIPSLVYICRKSNNKKKEKLSMLKEAYKPALILPLIALIELAICFIYTGGMESNYAIMYDSAIWSPFTLNHPILFSILYVLNFLIHSILFVNIGLIVSKKFNNYFVSLVITILSILGLQTFLEIGIQLIFNIVSDFNINLGIIFNIINMVEFNDQYGFATCMIVPFILTVISSMVVNKIYRKSLMNN